MKSLTKRLVPTLLVLVVLALAAPATAQEPPSGGRDPDRDPKAIVADGLPAEADTSSVQEDYRGRVVTAVALMFTFIIGFVVISQRRGAKMREEVEHLQRRLEELEARKGA